MSIVGGGPKEFIAFGRAMRTKPTKAKGANVEGGPKEFAAFGRAMRAKPAQAGLISVAERFSAKAAGGRPELSA